jgi:hypothetical protein
VRLILRAAYGDAVDPARLHEGLTSIARMLEEGDIAKAAIRTLLLRLPNLPDRAARQRLDLIQALLKANFNPAEPRDERGRWTTDGSTPNTPAGVELAGYTLAGATPEEKERFIDQHYAAAAKVAKELGVPVENILGLSALESGWGKDRFAQNGLNNYFSMHYPAPFASSYVWTLNGKVRMATFASYEDSLRSWANRYADLVRGISDPAEFAAALQDAGAYGINPDGSKVQGFVQSTANTIIGIGRRLEHR